MGGVIISRILGPSLKGSYSILLMTIKMMTILLVFGFSSANVYQGSKEPQIIPTLTYNSILTALVLGTGGIAVVWIGGSFPQFHELLNRLDIDYYSIRWLIVFLPLLLVSNYLSGIIRAANRFVLFNLVGLTSAVTSFLGILFFVYIGQLEVFGALIAWALATFSTTIITLIVIKYSVNGPLRFSFGLLKESFSYGSRLHLGNIAQFLNYRLDIFLVAYFLTPLQVGIYATATSLAERLWELPAAFQLVLLHNISKRDDKLAASAITAKASRFISGVIGIFCIALATLAYPFISLLYGQAYIEAAPILIILIPGIWTLSIGRLCAVHLAGSGRPQIATYGAVISLVATIMLDLLLIPSLGITGAAIASSISYVISSVVIVRYFLVKYDMRWQEIVLPIPAEFIQLLQAISFARFSRSH